MKSSVQSIQVEFGNARFNVYKISIGNLGRNIPTVHFHKYYEIHFALQGKHLYKFSDSELELTSGEMLIIPPETTHTRIDASNKKYHCSVLEFALEKIQGAPDLYDSLKELFLEQSLKKLKVDCELLDNLNKFKSIEQEFYCNLKTSAYLVINSIISKLGDVQPKQDANPKCDDVGVLMDNLINKGANLKEIAQEIYYTERHTARLINQRYGETLTSLNKKRKNNS